MMDELVDQIENIIVPAFSQAGYELIELKVNRHNLEASIQVLADRISGGITIDECSFLNKKIIGLIEQDNLIPDGFTLEVSSPGLDRVLTTQRDFILKKNCQVRFYLLEMLEGQVEHLGVVKGVEDSKVIVDTKGKEIRIPLTLINKARQIIY